IWTPRAARWRPSACARSIAIRDAARAPTIATAGRSQSAAPRRYTGCCHPIAWRRLGSWSGFTTTVLTGGKQLATQGTGVKSVRFGSSSFGSLERDVPRRYLIYSVLRATRSRARPALPGRLHHHKVAHAHLLDDQGHQPDR